MTNRKSTTGVGTLQSHGLFALARHLFSYAHWWTEGKLVLRRTAVKSFRKPFLKFVMIINEARCLMQVCCIVTSRSVFQMVQFEPRSRHINRRSSGKLSVGLYSASSPVPFHRSWKRPAVKQFDARPPSIDPHRPVTTRFGRSPGWFAPLGLISTSQSRFTV